MPHCMDRSSVCHRKQKISRKNSHRTITTGKPANSQTASGFSSGTTRTNPLRRHGDILEQLGGTQSIIRSRPVIAEACRLYSDPLSGRPRKGAAGKGGGSIRRFARVLRQLDLTFDPELMPAGGLSAVLPVEFDGWRRSVVKATFSSSTATRSTATP